jgi:hypothetical protein
VTGQIQKGVDRSNSHSLGAVGNPESNRAIRVVSTPEVPHAFFADHDNLDGQPHEQALIPR